MKGFLINIWIINSPYHKPIIITINSRSLEGAPVNSGKTSRYLSLLFLYSSILEIFMNVGSHRSKRK